MKGGRERESAATHGKQESGFKKKKERKTARLFAPTCLDLKDERGRKTKTRRRLGRLEKGNMKERMGGRGGEEEVESRYVRSPKRPVGV